MSGLFSTRWASLIEGYSETFSTRFSPHPEYLACLVVISGDVVVWASKRYELSSFPSFPDVIRLRHSSRKVRYELQVLVPSMDGFSAHFESFRLKSVHSSPIPGRVGWVRINFLPSRISTPGGRQSLFGSNRRISGYSRDYVRRISLQGMRASSNFFLERKKDRVLSPNVLPNKSSTFQTNFIREEAGVTITDSHGTINVQEIQTSSTRVNTPNYFSLRKSELPVNPYTMTQIRRSTRVGYQTVNDLDYPVETRLSWVGPTEYFYSEAAPDLIFDPVARDKAFKRLLSSIDADTGRETANLAESTSQIGMTIRMIGGSAVKLLQAVRAVRRGDFSTASTALFGTSPPRFRKKGGPKPYRTLAENWLEYQYGWKPLLSDIKAIVDSLHREYHPLPRVARGSGATSVTTESVILAPFNISLASVTPFPAGTRVKVKHSRVEIGIRYTVSDQAKSVLAQTGFLSPVSLAWELLPFSFVVDWFYPIGPYLESLHAFDGMTFLDGYESRFVRETTGVIINSSGIHGVSPQRVMLVTRAGSQRSSVKFDRVKLSSFPARPDIRFKSPLSLTHAANAVALLVSGFGK